uniref:Maturase K n=1 Tax=Panagrolaimus sp. PS1159 TaxID=55785 RepID=A0AC35FG11_9BILA
MDGSRNFIDFPSNFIHKINRYSVELLILRDLFLSFDELKFLSRGVKEFRLCWSFVKYGNDEPVPLENIVELFQSSKTVFINFSGHPRNATCKSHDNLINACRTIEKVELLYLPNDFDVYKFYQHLKHSKNCTSFIIDQKFFRKTHLKLFACKK